MIAGVDCPVGHVPRHLGRKLLPELGPLRFFGAADRQVRLLRSRFCPNGGLTRKTTEQQTKDKLALAHHR
ncbi:hypothetical protein GCM10007242_28040 [Pigmentiphaga litoralis]|nr:hypothetical protein GCM10007242_28040 [Pigmentiphaga litoralis]